MELTRENLQVEAEEIEREKHKDFYVEGLLTAVTCMDLLPEEKEEIIALHALRRGDSLDYYEPGLERSFMLRSKDSISDGYARYCLVLLEKKFDHKADTWHMQWNYDATIEDFCKFVHDSLEALDKEKAKGEEGASTISMRDAVKGAVESGYQMPEDKKLDTQKEM